MLGFLNLFSGGALTPVRRLRPRDHAVHHLVDHHADPRRGDPQARGVAEPGRGRPAQDHPVDALPDHRPSRCSRPPASPSCSAGAAATLFFGSNVADVVLLPDFTAAAGAARRPHAHRRHRPAHVDGRAHHPARHRQRHVDADLRVGRQPPAVPVRRRAGRGAATSSSASWSSCRSSSWSAIVFVEQGQRRIPVQFAKRVVGRRMYGGQSTYIPLKVNQAGVIPIIFASSVLYLPGAAGATSSSGTGSQNFVDDYIARHDEPGCTCVLYGLLIVGFAYFYTAIAFDPRQAGRPDPQAGRLHPRHPARPPDRALPGQDPEPHHPARRPVHRHHRPPARRSCSPIADVSALPVRRHHGAHRRRRGPRDHEADRQPAHDAELRGLPEVRSDRAGVIAASGWSSSAGREPARAPSACGLSRHYVVPTSRPATCCGRP